MKEKKVACNHPETDALFRNFPWPKNLTNSYDDDNKYCCQDVPQSVEISGNLRAEICARYVKELNLKYETEGKKLFFVPPFVPFIKKEMSVSGRVIKKCSYFLMQDMNTF